MPSPSDTARRFRALGPVLGLLLGLAPLAAQASIEGLWLTDRRDGVVGLVEVAPCGSGLCGTVLRGFDTTGGEVMTHAGRPVLRAMVPTGPGRYEGEVLDPRNGRVYLGRLREMGSELHMEGCVLGGLICATSIWRRP